MDYDPSGSEEIQKNANRIQFGILITGIAALILTVASGGIWFVFSMKDTVSEIRGDVRVLQNQVEHVNKTLGSIREFLVRDNRADRSSY